MVFNKNIHKWYYNIIRLNKDKAGEFMRGSDCLHDCTGTND